MAKYLQSEIIHEKSNPINFKNATHSLRQIRTMPIHLMKLLEAVGIPYSCIKNGLNGTTPDNSEYCQPTRPVTSDC